MKEWPSTTVEITVNMHAVINECGTRPTDDEIALAVDEDYIFREIV
jgi:hypothetical protein